MADALKVFVSSTFHDYALEREFLEIVLREMAAEPLLYPEHGTPGRDEYLEALSKAHIVLLMVPERDSEPVKDEIALARAVGVPMITFFRVPPGSDRTYSARIKKRSERFRVDHSDVHVCIFDCLAELRAGVRSGVTSLIASRMSSNLELKNWTDDVYEQARVFVPLAGRRLAIAQETSSLVLGPKRGRLSEKAFLDACFGFLSTKVGAGAEFVHVFDAEATRAALVGAASAYPEAKASLVHLSSLVSSAPASVSVIPVVGPVPPAIVGTDRFQIATAYGDKRFYMWLRESRQGANTLMEILRSLDAAAPITDFLADMDTIAR